MEPLVTVAITSFNYGAYVGQAIASVLAQTYPKIEILILDNASTDNSLEVIRRFEDPRLRVVTRHENIGLLGNLIDATVQATGEYIVFLSADDMLLPTLIADAVEFRLEHPEIDVVYGSVVIMDDACNLLEYFDQPSFDGAESYRFRDEFASLLTRDSSMYLPTMLFPKSVFEELGVWDGSMEVAADYEFAIRMASVGKRFAFTAKPGALIRHHGENTSGVKRFVGTGKQLREFCTLLERYTQPRYHQQLAGWRFELDAMVDRKIAEMRVPYPEEYARQSEELESYVARARQSIASLPAVSEAALRAEALVSVVVPFHGRIGPLQRALASLHAQTYDRWEAIVVADGAFDPSDVIEWMGLGDRARVARTRALRGPSAARNLGIGAANGEIVAYLDEDNRYGPEYLRAVASALADPGASATLANARFAVVAPGGEILSQEDREFATSDAAISYVGNALPLNCIAHRRSCFGPAAGAFNVTLNALEDWEFLLRLNRRFRLTPLPAARVHIDADVRLRGHHVLGRRTSGEWNEYVGILQTIYKTYAARTPAEEAERAAYAASLQDAIQRGVNAAGNPAGVLQFLFALAGEPIVRPGQGLSMRPS